MIDPAVLVQVPGCEDGRAPLFQSALPGGRGCNDIRYLETPAGQFVLRTRLAPLTRPGADAGRELACHRVAAEAGLAPQIITADPGGNWILMQWLSDRQWQEADLAEVSAIDHLGGRLARLHALAVPAGIATFDAPALAREQYRRIAEEWPLRTTEAAALVTQLECDEEALAGLCAHPSICHGDLQMANCLGRPLRLVDWEYAQIANPAWDLACLLAYHPQIGQNLDRLLHAAGLDGHGARSQLAGARRLFSILNRLWALAQNPEAG